METSESTAGETMMSTTSGGGISAEECTQIDSQSACEAAVVSTPVFGSCLWITVIAPDATCTAVSPPAQECVGVAGADAGCQTLACDDGESINAYYRTAVEGLEVFVNPLCGPEPSGWSSCSENDPPPECACACDG